MGSSRRGSQVAREVIGEDEDSCLRHAVDDCGGACLALVLLTVGGFAVLAHRLDEAEIAEAPHRIVFVRAELGAAQTTVILVREAYLAEERGLDGGEGGNDHGDLALSTAHLIRGPAPSWASTILILVSSPCSLLLVDDEPEILESLRRALRDDGYELLTTTSPVEAMAILAQRHIDVLVSDLRMPDVSGLELVTHVRKNHPAVVRVLLTGFATLDSALEAINEGAVGRYLTKPWDNDELRENIQEVVRGITSSSSGEARTHPALEAADLSPRLRETGAALLTGASEKQIASQLGLSPHTTHHYVKALYRRFGVSSRAEFMAMVQVQRKDEETK